MIQFYDIPAPDLPISMYIKQTSEVSNVCAVCEEPILDGEGYYDFLKFAFCESCLTMFYRVQGNMVNEKFPEK